MVQAGKPGWKYYPLVTLPAPLDIVWCRFPTAEMPSRPGPKSRPALVRCVLLDKSHTKARVEVTFGTSKLKTDTRDLDLVISNATDCAELGLPQATRFDLDLTVELPWSEEFFVPRAGLTSPIIGRLNYSVISQLEALKVFRRQR